MALYCLMYAVGKLPFGLAMLIYVSRAVAMPLTAYLLLGERSGPSVWAAVALGFLGAAISLWPAIATPKLWLAVFAAVGAALASAGSQTVVRRLTRSNSVGLIVLIYTSILAIATAPFAFRSWITPPPGDWLIVLALGLCAALAYIAAAQSYARATVSFLAAFDFLGFPAAAILGFVMFGEMPTVFDLVGGAIILSAIIMVVRLKSSESHSGVNIVVCRK